MRASFVLCVIALATWSAQVNAQSASSDDASAPTVTIINPGAEEPSEPAPKVLDVSPRAAQPIAAEGRGVEINESVSARAPEPQVQNSTSSEVAAEPESPVAKLEPTLGIDIDLSRQMMTVSENGVVLHSWQISSARYGYKTPVGSYQPTWMAKMWYSRQYDYAPMPHAIFFHKGVAIHATYALRALGRPASHGCVRLAPKNAAALFKLVNRHGKERTKIVVHGRPDHSGEAVAEAMPQGRRIESAPQQIRRGTPAYRYLPPSSYAARRDYRDTPRTRRTHGTSRRPPRGLYSFGYGF